MRPKICVNTLNNKIYELMIKNQFECFFHNHIQNQFKINLIFLIDGAVSYQLHIEI